MDFHYEVDGKSYDYSMPGGSSITLSELLKTLNVTDSGKSGAGSDIASFMNNVEMVEFSSPDLLEVVKTDNDWTITSVKPFTSEEKLTVTMKNGDEFEIKVTDAQGDPSGKNAYAKANKSGGDSIPFTPNIPAMTLPLEDLPDAVSNKTLESNGDGTYKLTLSVTAPKNQGNLNNKANLVIIYDSSNSMNRALTYHNLGTTWPKKANGEDYEVGEIYGTIGGAQGDVATVGDENWDDVRKGPYNGWDYFIYDRNKREFVEYKAEWGFWIPDTQDTRMARTKTIVAEMCESLLSNNEEGETVGEETVELAFVEFASEILRTQEPTANKNTVASWVSGCNSPSQDPTDIAGATNWEAALATANAMDFGDDDPTYIVFVSDGNPTTRNSQIGSGDDGQRYHGTYGTGASDARGYNLQAANNEVENIHNDGKTIVAIGIFGDASKMKDLDLDYAGQGDGYYNANTPDAIEGAFDDIIKAISARVGYSDVKITDGITGLTSTAAVHGEPKDFTYKVTKKDENGNVVDITGEALKEPFNKAVYNSGDDPSTADAESGYVTWDLGNKTLIEDATYSVSFIVWPDQDSYDLVADLNNGKIQYNDLTNEQKKQISKTTNEEGQTVYTLATNTAAKTEYTPIREYEDSEGNIEKDFGDPRTINLDPPEPMPLTNSKVKVQKEWNVSLSPGELDQFLESHPDYKVKLRLMKGSESGPYINNITIDPVADETVWPEKDKNDPSKDAEHYISTGLMVSEAKAVESGLVVKNSETQEPYYPIVSYNGTIYYVLETGRDYYFEEDHPEGDGADYHFEFEQKVFHPMVVDGEKMDVAIDGDTVTEMENLNTFTAVNNLKGGINLKKAIVDDNGNVIADPDTSAAFTISGSITKDGTGLSGEEKLEYRYYGNGHPSDGSDKGTIEDSSSFELTLHAGEILRIINVPSGYTYTFHEVPEDGSEYDFYSIEGEIKVDGKTLSPDESGITISGENNDMLSGISRVNAEQNVTVKNKLAKGSLEISKTVKVNDEAPAGSTLADGTYTFELWNADATQQITTKPDGTSVGPLQITVTNGVADPAKLMVDGLAPGNYVIKESGHGTNGGVMLDTSSEGYDAGLGGIVATVSGNNSEGVATAAFTNNYETTEATVLKQWVNNGKPVPESLTVTLLKNGVETDPKITKTLSEANHWTQTVTGLQKYLNGEEISYSWSEESIPGYFLTGYENNGTSIKLINTFGVYELETSYTGTKSWSDESNKYNTRPANLTVILQRKTDTDADWTDLDLERSWTHTDTDTWTYTFEHLPVFDDNGNVYLYQAKENCPEGYTPATDNTPTEYHLGEITYLSTKESHKRITPDNKLIWPLDSMIDLAFAAVKTTGNDLTLVWTSRTPTPQEKTAIANELKKGILPGYNPTLKWIHGNEIGTDSHGTIGFSMDGLQVTLQFSAQSVWSQFVMGQFNGGSSGGSSYEIGTTDFTNSLETTELNGTKEWEISGAEVPADPILTLTRTVTVTTGEGNDAATTTSAPEVVKVKDGETEVNLQPSWSGTGKNRTFTYTGLPAKDKDGNPYTYSVAEYRFTVNGVTYTVTKNEDGSFTATPDPEHAAEAQAFLVTQSGNDIKNKETTDFEFVKIWKNMAQETEAWPDDLTITVTMNASTANKDKALEDVQLTFSPYSLPEGWTVEVSDDGKKTTFRTTGLAGFDSNGNKLSYYVKETRVEGYNEPAYADSDDNGLVDADRARDGQQIINTHEDAPSLPHTGGIGTTIFYILGSILTIGCAVMLISRRRMLNKS